MGLWISVRLFSCRVWAFILDSEFEGAFSLLCCYGYHVYESLAFVYVYVAVYKECHKEDSMFVCVCVHVCVLLFLGSFRVFSSMCDRTWPVLCMVHVWVDVTYI